MMTLLMAVAAGWLAGSIHALSGPDHLAAIAPLTVSMPKRAWRVGVRWGLGHALGCALLVSAAFSLHAWLPLDAVSWWADRAVGGLLLLVGAWGLRLTLVHFPTPDELSRGTRSRQHQHAALGVGLVHGVAGTPHLLTLLPVLAFSTGPQRLAYLIGYGAGNLVAMGIFAWVVGRATSGVCASEPRSYRLALGACSIASASVGLLWVTI